MSLDRLAIMLVFGVVLYAMAGLAVAFGVPVGVLFSPFPIRVALACVVVGMVVFSFGTRFSARRTFRWGLLGAIIMTIACVLIALPAHAATASGIVHAACSKEGQSFAIWALGAVGIGNIVAWFDRSLAKSPAWLQAAVHFVALHWPKILVDLGVVK